MSATSQLKTFSDLYTDLQNRVRVATGSTATENQAKRYINIALQDMHLGTDYKFPWAERSTVLITQPQYLTGTCTVTKGSTTLTGISTLWNTNNDFSVANMRADGKIRIAGNLTPYRIASVSSDTAAVLSSKFTEESTIGSTYLYYEDEYDLASDFLRPLDIQRFSTEANIDLISRTEFRRRYLNNVLTTAYPAVATILDYAPSGNTTLIRRVKFHPGPSIAQTIPYSYITSDLAVSSAGALSDTLSADADEPVVPVRYRHALVFHGLYHWYRDKKDDTRSQEARNEYTDVMIRTSSDTEIGGKRPQIQPNVSAYASRAKRPYSGTRSNRRYDGFGDFDRMR